MIRTIKVLSKYEEDRIENMAESVLEKINQLHSLSSEKNSVIIISIGIKHSSRLTKRLEYILDNQ